jgi:hypothetical protein
VYSSVPNIFPTRARTIRLDTSNYRIHVGLNESWFGKSWICMSWFWRCGIDFRLPFSISNVQVYSSTRTSRGYKHCIGRLIELPFGVRSVTDLMRPSRLFLSSVTSTVDHISRFLSSSWMRIKIVTHIFSPIFIHFNEILTNGCWRSQKVDSWLRSGTSRSSKILELIRSDGERVISSFADVAKWPSVDYDFDFD